MREVAQIGPPNPLLGLPIRDDDAIGKLELKFGNTFTRWMLSWLESLSTDEDCKQCQVSYLEITVYIMVKGWENLPQMDSLRANCWCDRGASGAIEPTVGAALRLVIGG